MKINIVIDSMSRVMMLLQLINDKLILKLVDN